MEERNLDFDVVLSPVEWDTLAARAEALGPEEGGFDRDPRHDDQIRIFFNSREVPARWQDWVGDDETYGPTTQEVARLHFNTGRPYAEIEIGDDLVEPAYTAEEAQEMQRELENWVRGKWHELLRESGIHWDRGQTAR